ncbi:hypothetical protein ACER0C_003460 [Sarotherodon galilaeus]
MPSTAAVTRPVSASKKATHDDALHSGTTGHLPCSNVFITPHSPTVAILSSVSFMGLCLNPASQSIQSPTILHTTDTWGCGTQLLISSSRAAVNLSSGTCNTEGRARSCARSSWTDSATASRGLSVSYTLVKRDLLQCRLSSRGTQEQCRSDCRRLLSILGSEDTKAFRLALLDSPMPIFLILCHGTKMHGTNPANTVQRIILRNVFLMCSHTRFEE